MMDNYMMEEEYYHFKEDLRGVTLKVILGLVIGFCFAQATSGILATENPLMLTAGCMFFFSGVPYTWSKLPKLSEQSFDWRVFLIKLVLAAMLGWIITPIALIYNLVQVKAYEKRLYSANSAGIAINANGMPGDGPYANSGR